MTMPDPPFVPAAPAPRRQPPTAFETMRILRRNPLELWGEAAYRAPYVVTRGLGHPVIVASDPGLIRHVLIDNAGNYRMSTVRQKVLRPILRDGLLTAEGEVWRRSRRAMAPVFTPRRIAGFAPAMLGCAERFAARYSGGGRFDIARDMTMLTFEILAETLFSGEVAGGPEAFARQADRLFDTMGRVDPLDALRAPDWLPRLTKLGGWRAMRFFRRLVAETIRRRRERPARGPAAAPPDFLALLLAAQDQDGLSRAEVEDNLVTFIGAGHETTARALGWTLYCLAAAPGERERVEAEVDRAVSAGADPAHWLDAMPFARAAFEEALRLFPPAPSINREPIETDRFGALTLPKGAAVLVMPWIVHRHRLLWDEPDAYLPERFHPGRREAIDRFQFLPFGAGPRVCIGAGFALQEAAVALAVLLSRFRFDLLPETRPWPVQRLTVQPQGGLPMRVTPRR